MQLRVDADKYQYRLLNGEKVLGHYVTVEGLLKGAREAVRKDRSKKAADLREWIQKGLEREGKMSALLKVLADAAVRLEPRP